MKHSANGGTEIIVIKVVTSISQNILNAELSLVKDEIEMFVKQPSKYQKAIPENSFRTAQQLTSLLQTIANTLSTEQL